MAPRDESPPQTHGSAATILVSVVVTGRYGLKARQPWEVEGPGASPDALTWNGCGVHRPRVELVVDSEILGGQRASHRDHVFTASRVSGP